MMLTALDLNNLNGFIRGKKDACHFTNQFSSRGPGGEMGEELVKHSTRTVLSACSNPPVVIPRGVAPIIHIPRLNLLSTPPLPLHKYG